MSDKLITREVLEAYISILSKQVEQTSLMIKTLEELNDKLTNIEGHFSNGFRQDIIDHTTNQIAEVIDRLEKSLTTLYLVEDHTKLITDIEKNLNATAYKMTTEVKDKIGELKGLIGELNASMKVEKAVSIIGWSSFILSMLTIVLKLFGKI
jgi:uncharacterized protein Yka (UPF0111/DUF47 family)